MRQVVLDTETTGLEVEKGHRVIELGCVELVNRRRTHRTLHHYLQPDRDIDPGAQEVHGISAEMLVGKPRFAEVAQDFLEFVADAELVIHNAAFDVGFLNAELRLLGSDTSKISGICTILDTLALARRLHPGQRNSLDALCKRYSVDNTNREYHGALLDAQLLADVYLAMTGGQAALLLDPSGPETTAQRAAVQAVDRDGLHFAVVRATTEDLAAHARHLALLDRQSGGKTLWRKLVEQGR
ncbi:MAG: DNA polymerase III subunit epsilon [Gammaproteobacteria bacterium]